VVVGGSVGYVHKLFAVWVRDHAAICEREYFVAANEQEHGRDQRNRGGCAEADQSGANYFGGCVGRAADAAVGVTGCH